MNEFNSQMFLSPNQELPRRGGGAQTRRSRAKQATMEWAINAPSEFWCNEEFAFADKQAASIAASRIRRAKDVHAQRLVGMHGGSFECNMTKVYVDDSKEVGFWAVGVCYLPPVKEVKPIVNRAPNREQDEGEWLK